MRHIIYNILFIGCVLLGFACEADKENMGGVGYLRLGVVESNDVITKAEETYNPEVFTVTITNKTSGEVAKTIEAWAKGEKQEIALEPGTYTISAVSAGYDKKAAFDKPYYAGQEEIQITAGNAVEKTVTCTLANVRVSVVFDEALLEKYADRTITVSVDGGAGNALNFGRQEAGRDKQAYFPVADLTATISITKPQGSGDATPYEYSYTIDDVQAKHWYILTYRLPDTGDGDFTVTYDPTMKTYNYDFVVNPVAKNTASLTANAWAKFAYLTATDVTVVDEADISNLKFQYKKKADSGWTNAETQKESVAAETDGEQKDVYTATIKGLEPGTVYEYRLANADETFVSNDEFTTEAATELYNGSFDNWYNASGVWYAVAEGDYNGGNAFWDSGNKGASAMGKNPTSPEEGTEYVHGGKKSAKLKSQFVGLGSFGQFAAGNLYTGHFVNVVGMSGAEIQFGSSFTARPTQLRGFFQYTAGTVDYYGDVPEDALVQDGGTDMNSIYIALSDANAPYTVNTKEGTFVDFDNDPNIIAYGELPVSECVTTNGWKEFTIDLVYRDLVRKPKYIIIVCSASKYGDYFTGSTSSVMYIDDFELVYGDTPVVQEK